MNLKISKLVEISQIVETRCVSTCEIKSNNIIANYLLMLKRVRRCYVVTYIEVNQNQEIMCFFNNFRVSFTAPLQCNSRANP